MIPNHLSFKFISSSHYISYLIVIVRKNETSYVQYLYVLKKNLNQSLLLILSFFMLFILYIFLISDWFLQVSVNIINPFTQFILT